jgi:hypothetical protein
MKKMFFIYQFENNQMLKRLQHDNMGLALVFVIPNQVLNLVLKQVQGLTNSGSNDFGISVLALGNLGFYAPPCGRGSLL